MSPPANIPSQNFSQTPQKFRTLSDPGRIIAALCSSSEPHCELTWSRALKAFAGIKAPEERTIFSQYESPAFYAFLRRVKQSAEGDIYIYGGGSFTLAHYDAIVDCLGHIAGIIDKNPNCLVQQHQPVIPLDAYQHDPNSVIIVLCPGYENVVAKDLQQRYTRNCRVALFVRENFTQTLSANIEPDAAEVEHKWHQFYQSFATSPKHNQLVADGYYELGIAKYASSKALPTYPGMQLDASVWAMVDEYFTRLLGTRWSEAFQQVADQHYILGEIYSDWEHIVIPYLDLLNRLHRAGRFAACILIVSQMNAPNPATLAKYPWLIVLNNPIPEIFFELQGAIAPQSSNWHQHAATINWLRKPTPAEGTQYISTRVAKVGFFRKVLKQLIQDRLPKAFFGIQEHHWLCAIFIDTNWLHNNQIPTFLFQHGVPSAAIGPFFFDTIIGWRDLCSQQFFSKAFVNSNTLCLPLGSDYFDRLKKRFHQATEVSCVYDFVFFFQGAPYWHCTHFLAQKAVELIKKVLHRSSQKLHICIKSRNDRSWALLNDLFPGEVVGNSRVTLLDGAADNILLMQQSRWVGVLSSGAAMEALHCGKPVFAIEDEQVIGIARFSDTLPVASVKSAEDLLTLLEGIAHPVSCDYGLDGEIWQKLLQRFPQSKH